MTHQPTFISLFSGCGGLDAGFIDAGFRCLRAFDISKAAIEVHNANLGPSGVVLDLRTASIEQILAGGSPDVLAAGSPCQGFSTAGKRDLNDPRNSLLLAAGEIAVKVRPKVFVAENVAGALSGTHRKYWDGLEALLRSAGYSTKTIKINAEQIGLAQRRSRVIFFAWLGTVEPRLPVLGETALDLRKALHGIDSVAQHKDGRLPSKLKHLAIAKHIKPGEKLCNVRKGEGSVHTWNIPTVFGETSRQEKQVLEALLRLRRRNRVRDWGDADPVYVAALTKEIGFSAREIVNSLVDRGYVKRKGRFVDLANTFNGLYRRLKWDSISPTVDTKFGDMRFFLHPEENRGFSVREAARIQGFPDQFLFKTNAKESFTLIGNAVPPPMAKYLAVGALSLI
jgi:DNA (cytosine-5)-methyltransferase 1